MQIANCNLKHLTFEPDWKEVVVNPQAVRYSPINTTSDAPDTLEKENQLLSQRLLNPSAQSQNESAEAAKPCATAAAALNQKLQSRHALPTTPEDWEALKQDDFTAWMMAFSSAMMSPEQIAEMRADMREHPEKYQQDSNPDLQLLMTWGRAFEVEDRAKMGDSQ